MKDVLICEKMTRKSLIRTICDVPADFSYPINFEEKHRQQIISRLKKRRQKIRIDHIIEYLKDRPELIEKWSHYSEDKRGGFPVYFGKYEEYSEFGGMDKDIGNFRPILKSQTPELPCALFIIFELELFKEIFLFDIKYPDD